VIVATRGRQGHEDIVGCLWDRESKDWHEIGENLDVDHSLANNGIMAELSFPGVPKLMHRYPDGTTTWSWRPHHSESRASMDAMYSRKGLWIATMLVGEWEADYRHHATGCRINSLVEGT
jgi:hypothetical protein